MRPSAAGYETIFRASPVALALVRPDSAELVEANMAFEQLSGWRKDELMGRSLLERGRWGGARDRDRFREMVGDPELEREAEASVRTRSGLLRDVVVVAESFDLDGEEVVLVLFHDITERKRSERELEHLALHDPLTGLANRTLFLDRLEHALGRAHREGTAIAVLFMDLDGFKGVNDTFGHARGDHLLRAVASRIQGCFREHDTFARLGGDEFAGVLERVDDQAEVDAVAERFRQALGRPFCVEGRWIPMAASIGIALATPPCEASADELVDAADGAMYRAKAVDGTSFHVLDAGSHFSAGRRAFRRRVSYHAVDLRRRLDSLVFSWRRPG